MAEMKPMTAADSRSARWRFPGSGRRGNALSISLRMMSGVIWKVDALPTPLTRKSTSTMAKNPQKLAVERNHNIPSMAAIMAMNIQNVTLAPPRRSAIQPLPARESAPIKGPMNA